MLAWNVLGNLEIQISEALSHKHVRPRSKGPTPFHASDFNVTCQNCTFFCVSVILVINALVFGFVLYTQILLEHCLVPSKRSMNE